MSENDHGAKKTYLLELGPVVLMLLLVELLELVKELLGSRVQYISPDVLEDANLELFYVR